MNKETFKIEITALEKLEEAANLLLEAFPAQKIFLFEGNLGAGKTTFIQAVCKLLGISDKVTSPTYSIINEYNGENHLVFHLDLYRLKSERELLDIGFESYLNQEAYLFIEWPELAIPFLEEFVSVKIQSSSSESRLLEAELKH